MSQSTDLIRNMGLTDISRRSFMRLTGLAGGGLVLGVSLSGCSPKAPFEVGEGEFSPNVFLQFTDDNRIVFHNPRDEMGQGIFMGLTTIIAEELNTVLRG